MHRFEHFNHAFFGGRGHRHGRFGHGGGGFFDRFGGGPMGPGLRAAKMLASGDLQIIILVLLSEKPRHGYEIIKALEEHSSGVYTPSPGMVYPALTYLEEMNYAASQMEGNKKLYQITEAGAEYLAKNRAEADQALAGLAQFGEKMAHLRKHFAEEEEINEQWGGGPREQAKKEWRQMKMEFHELKQDLKTAIFEKIHAPMEEKKRVLDILRRAVEEIRGKK